MSASTVFIVDDDAAVRFSLSKLLESAALPTSSFFSAEEALKVMASKQNGCLLLDVRMPGMGGIAMHEELVRRGNTLPIIFLTGHADLQVGVEAMKLGAFDFLSKPVNGEKMIERVQSALSLNARRREAAMARERLDARLQKLSNREKQVLTLAIAGMTNQEISAELIISMRTVEGHRSRIYLKLNVGSLLELAQQAATVGKSLVNLG